MTRRVCRRPAEARVDLSLVNRCVEAGQFRDSLTAGAPTCAEPSTAVLASYPDVPTDLICTGATCTAAQNAPVYFSTVRLEPHHDVHPRTRRTWTRPRTGSKSTRLSSSPAFPSTNDGSARSLWLDSVYTHAWGRGHGAPRDRARRQGHVPHQVLGEASQQPRRLGFDDARTGAQRPLDRMRISSVWTEMGGRIDVTYALRDTNLNAVGLPAGTLCPQAGRRGARVLHVDHRAPATPRSTRRPNDQLCYAVKTMRRGHRDLPQLRRLPRRPRR